MQNFRALGALPPEPRASGGWGLRPQTPKTAPPLRISGYAPGRSYEIASEYHKTWPRRCLPYATFENKTDLDVQDHTKHVIFNIKITQKMRSSRLDLM